ncbi:MAG: Fe-S cluster assembly ATPase SufC [Candidatus Babeliales bacterium]|nr:Fe-S cluster assembly ATPase SufC [Candidatus Babeliales bacterium]
MLLIKNLTICIENKEIIKDLCLEIKSGEIHALMGPEGSGKSALAYTLLGHPKCKIIDGAMYLNDNDITDIGMSKRAKLGIFFPFQCPQKVPGLQVLTFLKEVYSTFTGKQIIVADFKILLESKMRILKMNIAFASRNLNGDFTSSEKKHLEMLQLLLINPNLAILDEIDSGLDIDNLKIMNNVLNLCKKQNPNFMVILVTHNQKILDFIIPDFMHVFNEGNIIKPDLNNLLKNNSNKLQA